MCADARVYSQTADVCPSHRAAFGLNSESSLFKWTRRALCVRAGAAAAENPLKPLGELSRRLQTFHLLLFSESLKV